MDISNGHLGQPRSNTICALGTMEQSPPLSPLPVTPRSRTESSLTRMTFPVSDCSSLLLSNIRPVLFPWGAWIPCFMDTINHRNFAVPCIDFSEECLLMVVSRLIITCLLVTQGCTMLESFTMSCVTGLMLVSVLSV